MKSLLKFSAIVVIISLTVIACSDNGSSKSESTKDVPNTNSTVDKINSTKAPAEITKSGVPESRVDFSAAKTPEDSLKIIQQALKSGGTSDCCCKYWNNGAWRYESASRSSCEDPLIGGTCVDASYCN